MVITENQDDARREWRSFELEQDNINKSRIGKPLTLTRYNIWLSIIIGRIN